VTDALARVMEMKGKADEKTRQTLANSSGAAAAQIKDLRLHLEKLEKRLQKMEGDSAAAPAKKPAAKKPATAKQPAKAAAKTAKPVVKKAAKPAAKKPPAKPKPPA
jgi:hypothetical protein